MGYHHLDPDALDPTADHPCDRRAIADAADLAQLAAARYTLTPGEDLATSYHSHDRREELFYVLAGTLAVETPEGTYAVDADEVFVVEPDSPIRPHNPAGAAADAVVLGVGAPKFDIAHPFDPEADEATDDA